MRGKFGAQDPIELTVAVLFDDVNAIVALDERRDFGRERQRAQAHVVELDAGFAQIIARFYSGVVRRSIGENGDLTVFLLFDDGRRHGPARRIVLADETIEISLPDLRHLGIASLFIVSRPAGENPGVGISRAGKLPFLIPAFSDVRFPAQALTEPRSSAPST